jgi:4-alpha-glucanotransferase
MQDHNYGWWKNRLKKNLELFDLVRIDHFRGFSKYWEVAANEKTAVNGKWVEGPAENFFDAIKEVFPDLPFVAEDLGDIDQPVYDLRDRYSLPGMNVLQFAFGDNINEAVHIPHNQNKNSITYTGTHDNNTVKGWFAEELNQVSRKRLELYLGKHVQKNTIHFDLIRMAFSSPAEICIIPMQDYLGLDSKHRMNQPSTEKDNWKWRLNEGDAGKDLEKIIQILTRLYGRF